MTAVLIAYGAMWLIAFALIALDKIVARRMDRAEAANRCSETSNQPVMLDSASNNKSGNDPSRNSS